MAGLADDNCDGVDDNCDGNFDEGSPPRAKSCPPAACAMVELDTDGDGLEDFIEMAGVIDFDCDGVDDLALPAVDPNHKDLLVELDWMQGLPAPTAAQLALIKTAFANAPVNAGGTPNPDGLPGINLWFDAGAAGDFGGGGGSIAAQSVGRLDGRWDAIRNAELDPGKEWYVHYGVIGRPARVRFDRMGLPVPGTGDPDLNEDGTISVGMGDCQDGMDNGDGDGLADNADPQCGVDPALEEDCAVPGTCPGSCQDGIDNAGVDGADGADTSGDCAGIPVENGATTAAGVPDLGSCYDGIDNSADGADFGGDIDDCLVAGANDEDGVVLAPPLDSCADGVDNGADGLRDGADPDCPNRPVENGGPADSCTDGFDNSQDGFDLGDADDCAVLGANDEDGVVLMMGDSCDDGIDNGADNLIDWQDPDCQPFPTEDGSVLYGTCWDGLDNIADGADGFDSNCTYGGGWGGLKGFIEYNGDPGTLMHELGHSLGLLHGGPFAVGGMPVPGNPHPNSVNCKPPYVSVMNYDHAFGIEQGWHRGGAEDGAGDATCSDGMDNGVDGVADQDDPDCQNGTDIQGNGILRILDFAPPRFNDVDGDGMADGRGDDLTAFSLNEAQLNEGVAMDPTDPWNLGALIDGFGAKVRVPMNGFNFMLNEATRAVSPNGAPGDCANGIDDNGDLRADTEDPNCYGYDYDSDGRIDPTILLVSNVETSDIGTGAPADCTNNITRVLNGPNDWLNLGIPAPGPGFELPPSYPPDPELDIVEETLRHQRADLQLRFQASSYVARVGKPIPVAVRVVNRGPNLARAVWVVFEATDGVELLPGLTSCIPEDGKLYCEIGTRARGGFADIQIEVRATLPSPGLIRRVMARVEAYEAYDLNPSNDAGSVPLYTTPSFTSFDHPEAWESSIPTAGSNDRTEGDASLELAGCGYATIRSPSFNTTEWEVVGSEFQLDVFVPASVPNPYWVGDIQLLFDSFPAGAYNVPVGQVLLTNLPRGEWSTLSFPLPEQVELILQDDVARSRLTLAVNTSLCGAEHLLLDNLRFGGDVVPRGGPHHSTGGQPTAGESIFTFDDLSDWSSSSPLSLETALVVQGSAALLVGTDGYSQATSRAFSTSELTVVTDRLSLDVRLNGPPPNPYWVGDVQLFFSCPSTSISSQHLGRADLFPVFFDEYNAVQFDVPANVKQVLEGNHSGCSFTIALSGSPSPEGFYLDNMGFVE